MTITLASHTPLTLAADNAAWLSWVPAVGMVISVLALGFILTMSFNRRERQLRTLAAQIASDLEEARALRTQLDEAHALASNMMVSAQRLTARLDERITALDMASLRMNATRNALPRVSNPPPHSRRPQPAAATSANVDALALSPVLNSIATAMNPPAAVGAATASPRASVEMKPHVDSFTQRVYELADAGEAPVAIARDLNEQVGKIELILALRAH